MVSNNFQSGQGQLPAAQGTGTQFDFEQDPPIRFSLK
jgi:hypothetical protein